ncbi:ABC transporter ATP-binding protein/permease [Lachnospiraceae bacterium OttesenSCG-928-D06]|nr:ABC transporter ATP-binding protein/permease [Lachnospiraceae bacterium OttesenSCG-928-D06]
MDEKKGFCNKILRKYSFYIIMSSIFLTFSAICMVVFAFVLGQIISSALNLDMPLFIKMTKYLVILILLSIIFEIIGHSLRNKYACDASIQYRNIILDKVLSLDIKTYVNHTETYYLNVLSEEVNMIKDHYFMQFPALIYNFMQIILGILALLYISWKLFIVVILLFLVTMILPNLVGGLLSKRMLTLSKKNENILSYLKSILGGFEVIKTFSLQSKILTTFDTYNKGYEKSQYEVNKLENVRNAMSIASSFIVQMGAIVSGVYLVFTNQFSISLLFVAIQIISNIISPISIIIQRLTWLKGTEEIRKKHDDIIMMEQDKKDTNLTEVSEIKSINIKDMSFAYKDSEFGIKKLNYKFERGKKYAVIGSSGSGKSTLLKLLMGYYDSYEGNIIINDIELRTIDVQSLYQHLSIMHQNVILFEDTMENNIKLYRNVNKEEFDKVIEKTNLNEIIQRFDESESIMLNDNYMNISGGEKQRIAIARSVLNNSDVILFDEATSSLDPQNTNDVYKMLFNLENILFIAVTHQWSDEILGCFDEVIYLKDGEIIESGSWDTIKKSVEGLQKM